VYAYYSRDKRYILQNDVVQYLYMLNLINSFN